MKGKAITCGELDDASISPNLNMTKVWTSLQMHNQKNSVSRSQIYIFLLLHYF